MNRLYQGDNLQILQSLPDASVDLIATDPPFFTQKDWGAFSDKWTGGLNQYLKFMEQRAVEMHRVLKDTGSLYLHCDSKASHYLKVMLDGVFGIDNFRNEIVWVYKKWTNSAMRKFIGNHDFILFYSKSADCVFNTIYYKSESTKRRHNQGWDTNITKGVKQLIVYDWDKASDKIAQKDYGRLVDRTDKKGVPLSANWNDISFLNSQAKERLGYPTQKPVALYERIIKVSSNQNDIVLDPFAGSGTTLDASQSLGRRWIGIDQSDEAINVIQSRLRERHGLEYDRDYERITQKGR